MDIEEADFISLSDVVKCFFLAFITYFVYNIDMEQAELTEQEIKQGAPLAAISYIFFLWLIVFIFKADNKFTRYHARQGLVIFIGEIVICFNLLIPLIGVLFYKLEFLILIIMSLYGIYRSLTGRLAKMPLISRIASKLII